MLRTTSAAVLIAVISAGCAYGYAGKEGKRPQEPQPRPNVAVVTVKESPKSDADKSDNDRRNKRETNVAQSQEAASPCGVRTFQIFYFDHSNRVQKTIDCVARKIIDEEAGAITESTYADWRAAGLPERSWYILVDPKGVRTDYLTNSALLKLSREFQIDYFGRDAGRDLLVYLYDDALK